MCVCVMEQSVCVCGMVLRDVCTHSQERDDAIARDSLEETWRSGQTLKPRPTGGEEGANHDDPRGRPCQCTYHKVTIDPFTKPKGEHED